MARVPLHTVSMRPCYEGIYGMRKEEFTPREVDIAYFLRNLNRAHSVTCRARTTELIETTTRGSVAEKSWPRGTCRLHLLNEWIESVLPLIRTPADPDDYESDWYPNGHIEIEAEISGRIYTYVTEYTLPTAIRFGARIVR